MTLIDFFIIVFGWALGNFIFNNFENHLPWWRRIAKLLAILFILFLIGLSGRIWIYVAIGIMTIGQIILHAYYFPKKGINGLTAEPYDKYLALIKK